MLVADGLTANVRMEDFTGISTKKALTLIEIIASFLLRLSVISL